MNTLKRYVLIFGFLIAISAVGIRAVLATPGLDSTSQTSSLHPNFALLDTDGNNVLESNNSVSAMQTCGQCHDTEFIQSHAFHSDLGLSDYQTTKDFNASTDRKSTRLNSSHIQKSRMPSSA